MAHVFRQKHKLLTLTTLMEELSIRDSRERDANLAN